MNYLLSIDQGTTSSRALIYDNRLRVVGSAQKEFQQFYPQPGWVEHDAGEIWETVLATVKEALGSAGLQISDIAALGIANQRETAVVWNRESGEPVHKAIVWQDRRTAAFLKELYDRGNEDLVRNRAGLLLDPYFSASKIRWILQSDPGLMDMARKGLLAAGTVESWLIWKLTGGRSHITDVSNASRTMLMNLHSGNWDPELMDLLEIPAEVLPRIVPTSGRLAVSDAGILGREVPITAAVGDQQAALFGQLCTNPGMGKCTYGTGCFLLQYAGSQPPVSRNRLLSTVAWQIGDRPLEYALEGSVFMGGASIQWLRDGLGIIRTAREVNDLAAKVPDAGGVVLVPAFTGLGAPHWDPAARGAILGLSRGTTAAHIARATLEGIACQVADLQAAMESDACRKMDILRVDGGASASDLLMQIQADLTGLTVERPENIETTALGAAMLAGLGAGLWVDVGELSAIRTVERVFEPSIDDTRRKARMAAWNSAVGRSGKWASES